MHPAVGVRPLAAVGSVADLPVPRGADRKRIARFDVRETHLAQVAFEEPLVVVAARGKTADPAQRENYRQFMNKFHHDWIVSLFVKPIKKTETDSGYTAGCQFPTRFLTISNDLHCKYSNFPGFARKCLKFYEPCGEKPKNKISVIYRYKNLHCNFVKKASGIG